MVLLGPSSVDLSLRVWCADSADAWSVKTDLTEQIKKRFDAEGIEIPYAYQNVVLKTPQETRQETPLKTTLASTGPHEAQKKHEDRQQ